MRSAPIAVLVVDGEGALLDANAASRALLRIEELKPGTPIAEVLGLNAPIATARPERLRVTRRCSDGTEQMLEVTQAPVDAAPVAALVLVQDVTAETVAERERARAEHELRFQKGLLEAQSEAAVEGILVVGADGKILSSNRRFAEMWAIPEDVVASRSDDAAIEAVLELVHDPEGFVERIRTLYANPRQSSRDEIRLKDGRVYDRYSAPILGGNDGSDVQGRVWFFQDVTEQRRNESALRFAAASADILAETLDPRVTLRRIARLAVPRLGDWCVIYRKTADDGIERVAIEFSDPSDIAFARQMERYPLDPHARGGVSAVIRTGRSQFHPHATPELLSTDVLDRETFADIVRQVGVSSWICVPLEARGRVIGAMSFVTSHSRRTYDETDLALAEDLGHRAGLAMDNASLFEHQRAITRTLQQSLLPRTLPDVPGLDVAVRYVAAGEGVEVGGDFYDLFTTGDDSWGLVIGDVVGKGPEAAALTALARYTVRTAAMQDPSPESVLGILNEAIYRQHEGARLCTAIYARIRREAGGDGFELDVARAGHPPPLVLHPDGAVEECTPPGLLLGVFSDAALGSGTIRLVAGDVLVLYTDGVVEARSGNVTLGEAGLSRLLGACAGLDADRTADEIERSVIDLQNGETHDDVALVVLRVEGREPGSGPSPTRTAWFQADPSALRDVREFVRAGLETVHDQEVLETAVLLADELAANAVRHARTEFRVSVSRNHGFVRVEVRDRSPLPPEFLPHDPASTSGRGLPIVVAESTRWGISRRADGKAVWFELHVDDEADALSDASTPVDASRRTP